MGLVVVPASVTPHARNCGYQQQTRCVGNHLSLPNLTVLTIEDLYIEPQCNS
jgi:hypothetical protein